MEPKSRRECIEQIQAHAVAASEMLAEVGGRLAIAEYAAPAEDADALMVAATVVVVAAQAHAATAQAWAALHATMYGA